MKALILIAAGLLSSGAIAQSTMNNMGGHTTGMTHTTKTTTMHHSMASTHGSKMMSTHHMARHQTCTKHMRHGHMMRTCSSHMMKPMHHTMMHKKVTVETKTKM